MLHFYIFIQQIYVENILNMLHTLRFFSSKCRLFHNATFFGSCVIHILYTGCAKIKKKNSVAKGLIVKYILYRVVHLLVLIRFRKSVHIYGMTNMKFMLCVGTDSLKKILEQVYINREILQNAKM